MKSKITITEGYQDFIKDCTFFRTADVYDNWDGEAKYIIASNLTKEELCEKYPLCMKELSPYLIVTKEMGAAFTESRNNEVKYEYRMKTNIPIEKVEGFIDELSTRSYEDEYIFQKTLKEAISTLTETEKRRLYQRIVEKKTLSEIDEGRFYKSSIHESIDNALKKMKKFFE